MALKLPFEEKAAKAAALISAGKTIASKFPNVTASLPNPAASLNLGATLDSIKNGAAFDKARSAIGDISALAGTLPADAAASLASAASSLTASMTAAASNLSRDLGVTLTNINMTNKLSYAAGAAPSASVLEAALGPMSVLKDGPAMLKEQAAKMSASVSSTLNGAFGAGPLPGADLLASAKNVGAMAASFASSVPAATIIDPDLGVITNPAYTAFAAIPGNATKLGSLSDLTSTASSLASDMTSKMADLEAAGAAALASATTNIKAMSLANKLGSAVPKDVAAAINNSVDINSVDLTAVKTLSQVTKPVPVFKVTDLYKQTVVT
jgi:hypothetical protein